MKKNRVFNKEFVTWDKKLEVLCDRFKERALAEEIKTYKEALLNGTTSTLDIRKETEDYYNLRCIEGRLLYYGVKVPSVKWDNYTVDFAHCGFVVSWYKDYKDRTGKKIIESATLNGQDFFRPLVHMVLVNAWPEIEKKLASSLRKIEKPLKDIKPLTEKQKEKQRQEFDCKQLVVSYRKFLRMSYHKNRCENDEVAGKSFIKSETYKTFIDMEHGFLVGTIYRLLELPHVKEFVENDKEFLKSLKENIPGFTSIFHSTDDFKALVEKELSNLEKVTSKKDK